MKVVKKGKWKYFRNPGKTILLKNNWGSAKPKGKEKPLFFLSTVLWLLSARPGEAWLPGPGKECEDFSSGAASFLRGAPQPCAALRVAWACTQLQSVSFVCLNRALSGLPSPGEVVDRVRLRQVSGIVRFGKRQVASLKLVAENQASPGTSLSPLTGALESLCLTLFSSGSQGGGWAPWAAGQERCISAQLCRPCELDTWLEMEPLCLELSTSCPVWPGRTRNH